MANGRIITKMYGKAERISEEDEKIKIKEFRKLVQDILESHHDDSFLLRWLRARDYDMYKSEKMIRESFKFRKKIAAHSILTSAYEVPEVYKEYPLTFSLGLDSENSSVRCFMAGICDYKGYVYSLRGADLMKLVIYFLETDLKMMQEKKKNNEKLELKTTFILDFQEFSLKKFYDKAVINAGIQLITMYQDNYPETLKVAYLVNVPTYFSWIFNIFKPFLNSVTLSKIKIYKTDEWVIELKKTVDSAIIPAFWGGERTDPDGDRKCNTLVNWNWKIDSKYYLNQNQARGGTDDPTLKSTVVPQRGVFQVPVEVQQAGSLLRWTFRTKDYNLRFGLFYRKSGETRQEEILPVDSVDCHDIPEENEFICDKAGTYILHFDNSYSWLTAKQLFYKVELEPNNVIETNNN